MRFYEKWKKVFKRWLQLWWWQVKKKMKDGRTYLTDSVPFSCCDPRVRRPCVHHNMLNSFQHTKYDSSNVTVYEIGLPLTTHLFTASFLGLFPGLDSHLKCL